MIKQNQNLYQCRRYITKQSYSNCCLMSEQWHIGNTSLISIIKELHYQQLCVFKGHLAFSQSMHCTSPQAPISSIDVWGTVLVTLKPDSHWIPSKPLSSLQNVCVCFYTLTTSRKHHQAARRGLGSCTQGPCKAERVYTIQGRCPQYL